MSKLKIFKYLLIFMLLMCLFGCYTPNNFTDKKVEFEVLSQKNTTNEVIIVDSNHSAEFNVGIYTNKHLVEYNTYNSKENTHIYSKSFEGDNIDDLVFNDVQVMSRRDPSNDNVFICEVMIKVTASNNWNSSILERNIKKITFSILDNDVEIPVNILIENSQKSNYDMVEESPIISNYTKTIDIFDYTINNDLYEFNRIVNFDPSGWGAKFEDDPDFIKIESFYLLKNNLCIKKISILENEMAENEEIKTIEKEINDINEVNYIYSASSLSSGIQIVLLVSGTECYSSDCLMMTYKVNGIGEEKTINIATIHVGDYNLMIKNYDE